MCESLSVCLTLYNLMDCSLPGSCPWNSPGQTTGVGSLSLLQGIFPMQSLNPSLLHCRLILYLLSHKGNPRVLEWVTYPFSSGSSQPRNQTGASCIADRFFTNWAIREAHISLELAVKILIPVIAVSLDTCCIWIQEEVT